MIDLMAEAVTTAVVADIRRIHGIGHLGIAMRHYPYLTLAVIVVVVALSLYQNRRR